MSISKVLLIGGIDSIGVPYTRDNKDRINHLKIVKNFLIEKTDEIQLIDMYCMNKYNTTDYIHELLSKNYSLSIIRRNQRQSIDLCRKSGIFQFIQLPKSMKEYYEESKEYDEIIISEEIKENNTMFIYTCGANDFLARMGTDLGKLIFPKKMDEALIGIDKTVTEVVDKIRGNIEELIRINSNIEIYVLGIYIPTKYRYIRDKVTPPIDLFNNILKDTCSQYENVYYIDNSNLTVNEMASVDWHPNSQGQTLIGNNIISNIKKYSKIYNRSTK